MFRRGRIGVAWLVSVAYQIEESTDIKEVQIARRIRRGKEEIDSIVISKVRQ